MDIKKNKEKCGDCPEFEECIEVCFWFKIDQITWMAVENGGEL